MSKKPSSLSNILQVDQGITEAEKKLKRAKTIKKVIYWSIIFALSFILGFKVGAYHQSIVCQKWIDGTVSSLDLQYNQKLSAFVERYRRCRL